MKGTMVRQSSSPESEPDFSALPPVGVGQDLTSYSNTMMLQNLGQQMERRVAVPKSNVKQEAPQEGSGDQQYTPSYPATSGQMPKLETPLSLTFGLPSLGDAGTKVDAARGTLNDSPDSFEPGRPRGTKFMRILARSKTTESRQPKEAQNELKSPDAGDRSQSS